MNKRWVAPTLSKECALHALVHEVNVPPVLASILVKRGICSLEDAEQFFRPDKSCLHDPFLMKDMDLAISRIEKAIGNKEKIVIYGDYDVDGTTAVALAYRFFKEIHTCIYYYIPDREKEGYGISKKGIDWAKSQNCSLILAFDCGIKAIENVQYAKNLGIDFIIGDHHMPGPILPNAVAVLDPKRNDCIYPFKELSGCGIAFKLIQAFSIRNKIDSSRTEQFLDLVAVSIAADIVSVTGENRILAFEGLKKLNQNPSFGLCALKELATFKGTFTIDHIVFQIGPRINAAGRIKHAEDAVKLLVSKNAAEATFYSEAINIQNTERRVVDTQITEEALSMIKEDRELMNRCSLVVYKQDWHKGVIGIVASRLMETFYRPAIVLTKSNGHVSGSARSIPGFNLYQALNECGDLLEQYGGHKYAAGLTMKEENVAALQERFEKVVAAKITPELLEQELHIDAKITLKEIDARFFKVLQRMEPFGPQNETPLFLCKGVSLFGKGAVVGEKHLKMTVFQPGSHSFDCIAFGQAEAIELVNSGKKIDLCFSIEENIWRNKKSIQLNVKGIRENSY